MMLLATALYWVLIGALALVGSAVVAHTLRRRGREERLAWAAGLLAAVSLPLLLPSLGAPALSPASPDTLAGPAAVIDLAPMRIGVVESSATAWLEPTLLALWALASLLLLGRVLLSLRIVHRIRDEAAPSAAGGRHIRLSDRHGPAVVGFLRPVVLVPTWVMRLPAARRDWILKHEAEHVRGRDPWFLAFALVARIALPWNPVVWAFGRRIRSAIETDCDRRTLGVTGDARAYAEALLAVAAGPRDPDPLPAMAPAFAERHVALEHRIESIARPRRRLGFLLRLGLTGVVGAVTVAACEMPAPTEAGVEATPSEGRYMQADANTAEEVPAPTPGDALEDRPATPGSTVDEPRFIPYDVPPNLSNRSEVADVLGREYPPVLEDAGIGGVVSVWLYLDEEGAVRRSQINESSGYEALDDAALRVADAMTFTPAQNRDRPTPVWVSIPITFTAGG